DALNKGIAMSSGEIIGWLNSDDVYSPGILQNVVNQFDTNPEKQWLFGKCQMIDEDDQIARSWITSYKNHSCKNYRYTNLLTENFISQPSTFFRKSAFLKTGPIVIDQHWAMDYDLWLRLANLSEPIFVDEYLSSFRLHGESKSLNNFKLLFAEQYQIHKVFDQRWYYLFVHKVKINIILLIYRLMAILK
ncbi:MAG: glycosyltransferase, partial [Prolixibacteraceae bacterium]|nr:glycosyltransferase [Prolixibacteraceae bacterium]